MTPEQAAARLGVAPHQVAQVTDHPDGHVVRTVDQALWLVTPTAARRYVPEVDAERVGEVAADPDEHQVRTTEPAPKPTRRRRATT